MAGRGELAGLPGKLQTLIAWVRQIVLQFEDAISSKIVGCPFWRRQSAEDFVGTCLCLLFAKTI